jgi:fibronectin type 3 domain-containing protein
MTKIFAFVLLLSLFAAGEGVSAPKPMNIAAGGARGIYVVTGIDLISPAHPVNGATGYRVERKKQGQEEWKQIATVSAPDTLPVFEQRLQQMAAYVPDPFVENRVPAQKLWQAVLQYRRIDSLHEWSGVLLVRLALGTTYLDTTAERGATYEYRVSKVDASGAVREAATSNAVLYPSVPALAPLRLLDKTATEKQVVLRWNIGRGIQPVNFLVMRKDAKDAYQMIDPIRALSRSHDTTLFLVEDTLVQPLHYYQYYIVPADYYGNSGAHSDTTAVASYDFNSVPLPDHLNATGFDSSGGVRVSWRLEQPKFVKAVQILRSESWDTGYKQIAVVSTQDTSFIDRLSVPMVKYYYRLIMVGQFDELSLPSARVFGLYKSTLVPTGPGKIKIEGENNGVKLQWQTREKNILGYYVYRTNGFNDSLHLITSLIPADSITTFFDTSSVLSGKLRYGYSVRTENTSHKISGFSETAYVRPLIPTQPPTPINLATSVHDRVIQLYWDDMRAMDNSVKGYYIFRREFTGKKKEEDYKKLNDTLLRAKHNNYIDTTAETDKTYEYAVQAVDYFDGMSGMSASAKGELRSPEIAPPAGLRAELTDEGIQVQWDTTHQPGITGFKVYRYERGKKPQLMGTTTLAEREFVDKKAQKGKLYSYYVTAVGAHEKESPSSDEVSVRR